MSRRQGDVVLATSRVILSLHKLDTLSRLLTLLKNVYSRI
jgi:hypothetical protein